MTRENLETGERQVLSRGPMGDGQWHPWGTVGNHWENDALNRSEVWDGRPGQLPPPS